MIQKVHKKEHNLSFFFGKFFNVICDNHYENHPACEDGPLLLLYAFRQQAFSCNGWLTLVSGQLKKQTQEQNIFPLNNTTPYLNTRQEKTFDVFSRDEWVNKIL